MQQSSSNLYIWRRFRLHCIIYIHNIQLVNGALHIFLRYKQTTSCQHFSSHVISHSLKNARYLESLCPLARGIRWPFMVTWQKLTLRALKFLLTLWFGISTLKYHSLINAERKFLCLIMSGFIYSVLAFSS